MRRLLVHFFVLLVSALLLPGCGGGGEDERCVSDYGFQVDGDSCSETGDSSVECPGVVCECGAGSTQTTYICFGGTCVTSIDDCDAWCAASVDEQFECI